MAFGGGGPIHASGLADALGISRIIIPPSPGVFSAFGLLFADVEHHFVRTYFKAFEEIKVEEINNILEELKNEGGALLKAEGFEKSLQEMQVQLDMKYMGQTSDLTINMPTSEFSHNNNPVIAEEFMREHDKTYGYRVDEPLQLVSIRVIARGLSQTSRVPNKIELNNSITPKATDQRVYFGNKGWIETPIINRIALGTSYTNGPIIIEEYDSTTVVPPGWRASLDPMKNIVLEHTP